MYNNSIHSVLGSSDGLVSALDLLPTVASIAGLNTSSLTLDGVDISPLLLDPLTVVSMILYIVGLKITHMYSVCPHFTLLFRHEGRTFLGLAGVRWIERMVFSV